MHWLLALALIPAVSASQGQTTPAQTSTAVTPPEGIPETFLTDLDYPKDALRLRQEGLSVVQLRVSTKGRVKACSVQQSSGSPSLDAATLLATDASSLLGMVKARPSKATRRCASTGVCHGGNKAANGDQSVEHGRTITSAIRP